MIEVQGLTKHYDGRPAIADLSFTVARGQRLGIVGPAGSGKSTTLRILAGLLSPTSGSAVVAGHDVGTRSRQVRRSVGFLPETIELLDEMRVEAFLRTMCQLRGVPPGRRAARIEAALQCCGLADQRGDVVGRLETDVRRRVGLAQAFVHDPEVLVLDEPGEARDLVVEVGRERAVVLSGPDRAELGALCDRVLVLEAGRVVADEAERPAESRRQAVVAVVRGDGTAAERHVRAVNGVSAVTVEALGGGAHRLTVTGEGDDLQDAVARAIVEHGVGLKELSTRPSRPGEDAR